MLTDRIAPRDISLREALREHTHLQHERLHDHSLFLSLFDQTLNLGEYRDLIKRLHGFYRPLDRAIGITMTRLKEDTAGYFYANRSGLLTQDMQDLGWGTEAIRESPQCNDLFDIVSPASLGGVVYVIEGAMLGGARIDRAAQKVLGREEPTGRRFWSWCRTAGGTRWLMTNKYLAHLEAEGADIRDLKQGAFDTFRLMAEWLAPLDLPQSRTGARPL